MEEVRLELDLGGRGERKGIRKVGARKKHFKRSGHGMFVMHVRQQADGAPRTLVLPWSSVALCGRHFGERPSKFIVTSSVSLGKSVIWLWVCIGVRPGKVGVYRENLRPHSKCGLCSTPPDP